MLYCECLPHAERKFCGNTDKAVTGRTALVLCGMYQEAIKEWKVVEMSKMTAFIQKHREVIAYLFWGGMTTIVSWGSYSIFALLLRRQENIIHLFSMKMSLVVLLSNVLSWVFAFLFAFVTNKLWVFQSKSWKAETFFPEFWKFLSARVFTGIFEILAVPLLVGLGLSQTIFGIDGMAAKVLVSVLVVLLNYIFSKLFIFKS